MLGISHAVVNGKLNGPIRDVFLRLFQTGIHVQGCDMEVVKGVYDCCVRDTDRERPIMLRCVCGGGIWGLRSRRLADVRLQRWASLDGNIRDQANAGLYLIVYSTDKKPRHKGSS